MQNRADFKSLSCTVHVQLAWMLTVWYIEHPKFLLNALSLIVGKIEKFKIARITICDRFIFAPPLPLTNIKSWALPFKTNNNDEIAIDNFSQILLHSLTPLDLHANHNHSDIHTTLAAWTLTPHSQCSLCPMSSLVFDDHCCQTVSVTYFVLHVLTGFWWPLLSNCIGHTLWQLNAVFSVQISIPSRNKCTDHFLCSGYGVYTIIQMI